MRHENTPANPNLVVSRPQPYPNLRLVSRRSRRWWRCWRGWQGQGDRVHGIIPALGVALLIGNVYYAHMATRMKAQFGRDFTAQPFSGFAATGGSTEGILRARLGRLTMTHPAACTHVVTVARHPTQHALLSMCERFFARFADLFCYFLR